MDNAENQIQEIHQMYLSLKESESVSELQPKLGACIYKTALSSDTRTSGTDTEQTVLL